MKSYTELLVLDEKKNTELLSLFEDYIKVSQQGKDKFTIQYGQQVKAGLNYAKAAHELGEDIFHYLRSESKFVFESENKKLINGYYLNYENLHAFCMNDGVAGEMFGTGGPTQKEIHYVEHKTFNEQPHNIKKFLSKESLFKELQKCRNESKNYSEKGK